MRPVVSAFLGSSQSCILTYGTRDYVLDVTLNILLRTYGVTQNHVEMSNRHITIKL